jgi:hypothetical protein
MHRNSDWEDMLDCMKKAAEAKAKGLKPEDCKEKSGK